MKIVLVIDETVFFHPQMLEELAIRLGENLSYVYIVDRVPKKSNLTRNFARNWFCFSLPTLVRLVYEFAKRKIFGTRSWVSGETKRLPSVAKTCRRMGVQCRKVRSSAQILAFLKRDFSGKNKQLDVLISSQSIILKPNVLEFARFGSINRHSGLLPSYGGLWPVVHALIRGESILGTTVHAMIPDVDKGQVINQGNFAVDPGQTVFEIYEKTFMMSAELIVEAIKLISDKAENEKAYAEPKHHPSYYSMPSTAEWKELRKRGWKFA